MQRAKARKEGSVGIPNPTVLNTLYAVDTDAKRNRNRFIKVETCSGPSLDGVGADYYIRVTKGRIGDPGKIEELYLSSPWKSHHQALAYCMMYFDEIIGKPKCHKCGAQNVAPCSRCCSCNTTLPHVFKPYKQVMVGDTRGYPSRLVIPPPVLPDRRCPKDVASLVELIYKESGSYVQSKLNRNISTSDVRPLGTLSLSQVQTASSILRQIRFWVDTHRYKQAAPLDSEIMKLSEAWYMAVPQNLGKRLDWKSLCLNTSEKVAQAERLLEIVSSIGEVSFDTDPDLRYSNLDATIKKVGRDTEEYRQVELKVMRSHSRHHSVNLKVCSIYSVNLHCQSGNEEDMRIIGNVTTLFHGTRNANLLGILRHGLSVSHSTVQNGSMFGRGIYFADVSTKSSQYSVGRYTTRNIYNTAFLLLCDVALGKACHFEAGAYLRQPPVGFDSVKGVEGKNLRHNEYVIYQASQHRITHLIEFSS